MIYNNNKNQEILRFQKLILTKNNSKKKYRRLFITIPRIFPTEIFIILIKLYRQFYYRKFI